MAKAVRFDTPKVDKFGQPSFIINTKSNPFGVIEASAGEGNLIFYGYNEQGVFTEQTTKGIRTDRKTKETSFVLEI